MQGVPFLVSAAQVDIDRCLIEPRPKQRLQYLEVMKQTSLKSEGSEMKAMFVLKLCLFTFILKLCLFQAEFGAASRSSPAVVKGSVTQHLCLDKMYQIQVMRHPKDSPHECVDFMNEACNIFQCYISHKYPVTDT